MLLSTMVVGAAFFLGWRIYSKAAVQSSREKDPLEKSLPALFRLLQNKFYVDEIYAATVIRLNTAFSRCADWLDRVIWGGAVNAVSALTVVCALINRAFDELRDQCRFRSRLRRIARRGRFPVLDAKWPRPALFAGCGPGVQPSVAGLDLGVRMKTFPLLTILTLIPLVGGGAALLASSQAKLARRIAFVAGLLALAVRGAAVGGI